MVKTLREDCSILLQLFHEALSVGKYTSLANYKAQIIQAKWLENVISSNKIKLHIANLINNNNFGAMYKIH